MADTVGLLTATTAVVIADRWSAGKTFDPKVVVGGTFVILAVAMIAQADETLATRIAALLFIVAVLTAGFRILQRAGIVKKSGAYNG